jgi:hypothetical protein
MTRWYGQYGHLVLGRPPVEAKHQAGNNMTVHLPFENARKSNMARLLHHIEIIPGKNGHTIRHFYAVNEGGTAAYQSESHPGPLPVGWLDLQGGPLRQLRTQSSASPSRRAAP